MKKTNLILTVLFYAYITFFFALNIITPDEKFSVLENRNLQQLPTFSIDDLYSGRFTSNFETYVTDQFVFRDELVNLKANSEKLLGKSENNGVYITRENTLIDKFEQVNFVQVESNINYVNSFAEKLDVPVYITVVPTQNDIYVNKLYYGAQENSQKEAIDFIKANTHNFIDVYDILSSKNDEYIFYNTDHHWTSLGAYYAYQEIAVGLGVKPVMDLQPTVISQEFYGTTYSKSSARYVKPDEISIFTENFTIEIENPDGITQQLMFDFEKLDQKDQYEVFLGGNHPRVTVFGQGEGKLLIVKDSYSNSLVQFLAQNYAEIHMIDLRFWKMPISNYVEQNGIDTVLVAYSVGNFVTDRDIAFLQ